ncbi:unnamed protein product, partial [Meganyctiphanes norvegica]
PTPPGTSTTTEVTTLTTTNPPSPSTLITSKPSSPPTTDTTTLASTTSPDSLACYQCIGCSSVDSSTPVISDASYQSCVTTVVLSDANVIRGGSYVLHPDGECAQDAEILSCWCSSSKCNNINI